MTYVPIDERLAHLEARILRAFPEQFDTTGGSFIAFAGLGADMHRLIREAQLQNDAALSSHTLRGQFAARAIANVVEELLGRCERTLAEYAEMDAWMEAEYAHGEGGA
jgi:hypothetical protein